MWAYIFFFYLTIPVLFWVFREGNGFLEDAKKRRVLQALTIAYGVAALVPMFGGTGDGMYLFFVALPLLYVLFQRTIRRVCSFFVQSPIYVAVPVFLLLALEETLLTIGYRLDAIAPYTAWSGILLHLISYTGFYAGLTVVIIFFHRRYQFSAWQTLIVGGLWGILVEQQFKGPLLFMAGDFVNLFAFVPFIFLTYGLYILWPKFVFGDTLHGVVPATRLHMVYFWIAVSVIPIASWLLWVYLLGFAGYSPDGVI